MKKYPAKWCCDISNNGKMLAFYDKAQIARYKNVKNIRGNQEELHIFNVFSKRVEQTQHYVLDMKFFLNSNEVLSFSFDDLSDEEFQSQHCINVQARDLYIYQIDYMHESILRKIDSRRTKIIMRSIFYEDSDYNYKKTQEVKQYIQEQEFLGNQVILPKFNNSYILVRENTSNLMQIYSIYLQKIVRKFILTAEELEFDQDFLE